MSENPKIIAVTLNWNRKEDTIECVKSLLNMDYPDLEIVVVDNGSTDGSPEAIKKAFNGITVIENKRNLGYALGFNSGINFALDKGAKYILILNNDTIIDENALRELVRVAVSDPNIGFVSGKVFHYYEPQKLQIVGKKVNFYTGLVTNIGLNEIDSGQYDEVKEYKFLDDVFLLAKADVFLKAGLYHPGFFLHYEETDLCARVNRAGFKLVYTPKAKIWHKGGTSSGGGLTPTAVYYLSRNKTVFIRRNARPLQFISFLFFLIFIQTPFSFFKHLVNKQFNCLIPLLHGTLSGIIWWVSNDVNSLWQRIKFKLMLREGYSSKKLWDEWGKTYISENGRKNVEPQHVFLINKINVMHPENILEVGCGFGKNLKMIKNGGFYSKHMIGMDISRSMIKKAREYLNDNSIDLICANGLKIPFGNKCFDMTFTHGCLMHVPPDEIMGVLEEIIRITKGDIINIEENSGDKEMPGSGILKLNEYTFAYNYGEMYQRLGLELVENRNLGHLNLLIVHVK